MTIFVDDAGTGDILWGVVIGAYRPESDEFIYDMIDISFFKEDTFKTGNYLEESARLALSLVERLEPVVDEKIKVCQGDVLNRASIALVERYGEDRVERVKVDGRGQELMELAYTNELRNLGYEPITDRTEKWGKSFWHMYEWVRKEKSRIRWVKTGFPNLKRFKFLREP